MLSIVSPVLNAAAFLPGMLASVRAASRLGVRLEHMIVDGGSSDGSLEIARDHMAEPGSPIVRVLEGPDRGQSHAINKGIALAQGKYVGWLNADDVCVPEGLARLASVMAESEAEVVLGRCRFVDPGGRTVFAPTPPDPVTPDTLLCLLSNWFAGRSIVQPEAFIRRDTLESQGGIDESLHYTMDHHLWVRLASAGAVFHSEPIEVARQLVHPGQKTADNIAVVREMLTYANGMLAERPQSDLRARAIREINQVASRLGRATSLVAKLDRLLEMNPGSATLLVHGRHGSIPESLLREWAQKRFKHRSIMLAGLDPIDRQRILESCLSRTPPVVVGRLPEVSAQFDLVVTARAGFEGLAPGAEVTRLLKPGGSLCVLGASPGSRYRSEVQSIRRAISDRVTFSTRTLLDEPDSPALMRNLGDLSKFPVITLPPGKPIRFLPDASLTPTGLGELAQRLQCPYLPSLSGFTIVDL